MASPAVVVGMEDAMQRTVQRAVSILICVAAVSASGATALGQAPPEPAKPVVPKVEQTDSTACGPDGTHATVGKGGDVVVRKADDKTLSSKLAASEGVICPPRHVDPEIAAPTPPAGPMPVIPPPGSPGGNPNVQPK